MSSLVSLFVQYGYQLALVGLVGMLLIEGIKLPVKKLISLKCPAITENSQKFDTLAFLVGVLIAAILGAIYSVLVSYTGIATAEGDQIVPLGVAGYFTNILAAWMYQTIYYNIYKKLGLKRLLQLLLNAVIALFDKNKNNKLDIDEAVEAIQNLLLDGKITKAELLDMAATAASTAITNVVEEAGDAATIDQAEQVQKLVDATDSVIAEIPNSQIQLIAKQAIELAKSKVEEVIEEAPIEQAIPAQPDQVKKPIIKF